MGHGVDLMLAEEPVQQRSVADVAFDKAVVRMAADIGQALQIACVGQLVEVDHPPIRLFCQQQADEVHSDKTAAASDEHCFLHLALSKKKLQKLSLEQGAGQAARPLAINPRSRPPALCLCRARRIGLLLNLFTAWQVRLVSQQPFPQALLFF